MQIDARYFGKSILASSFFLCCGLVLTLALYPPKVDKPRLTMAVLNIKDMKGQAHALAHLPKRIVFTANILPPFATLAGSLTSIIGATDLGRKGLLNGSLDRIFPDLDRLVSVGINNASLNVEKILDLAPDAVFAWTEQTDVLDKAAPFDVMKFRQGSNVGNLAAWALLGELTGQGARAAALLESDRASLDAISKSIEPVSQHRIGVLVLVSGADRLWIGPSRHVLNARLERAGAENIFRGVFTNIFSLEDVARFDPEVILISTFFDSLVPQDLFDRPEWQMIRAVRARKVYRVPDLPFATDAVSDPLLVQWLAQVLHPEVMNSDLRAVFRRTYQDVYHYALSDTEIDKLLVFSANAKSSGYERFAAVADRVRASQ